MSLRAIAQRPLSGHGRGNFVAAYGDAQESYLASGVGTPQEILALEGYEELYPVLHGYPDFMFEYGHALHKTGQYEASNKILSEAGRLSCDPMILNIMGKNCKEQGQYEDAEGYYLRSTCRVPNRMYPWYLLTLLYDGWLSETTSVEGEQSVGNPSRTVLEKRLSYSARHVMTMDVKVQSPAVNEMQEEVGNILERHEN